MQEARRLFRLSLRANPSDSRTLLQCGMLERRRRDWEAARKLFKRGVRLTEFNQFMYQASAARGCLSSAAEPEVIQRRRWLGL